jgi:hypothetical protein
MQYVNLVTVHICGSRPGADLAKNTLEASGISAMVQADTAGGMREHLAWSGDGFKILVREDAEAARDLLAQVANSQAGDSPNNDSDTDLDAPPLWRRFT